MTFSAVAMMKYRAKTAKSELSDVVLTKDMTREERRSAFLAAICRDIEKKVSKQ